MDPVTTPTIISIIQDLGLGGGLLLIVYFYLQKQATALDKIASVMEALRTDLQNFKVETASRLAELHNDVEDLKQIRQVGGRR